MNNLVLPSTFFLTLLMLIGLFFFIRASVKDRTQTSQYISDLPEENLAKQLQQYFSQRSYRIADVDAETNRVIFEGVVRPSLFLAVFLSLLAAVGALCLSLVLVMLFPQFAIGDYLIVALSPLSGLFYWQKAKRPEQVLLKVESEFSDSQTGKSVVTVTAQAT